MELLIRNLWSQVAGLVGRPRTILKIFYFIGDHQFFQISPGIKSLNDRGRKLIHLLAGRHNLGPGRQFQQIYWRGKPPGRISPGHLDRVYKGTRCITSFGIKLVFSSHFEYPMISIFWVAYFSCFSDGSKKMFQQYYFFVPYYYNFILPCFIWI